ncbi:hypothetical protein [Bordetella sp. 02P26C-1]|uniref:hypothetical protein n=1 Tax=Bordetella sp. 02P26C-1 TaxID=2683195 RepID=UPI0013534A37|nr:hypothetical protein [Bordetella sp. 02P26C-1]MVW78608.1 hypothetical protein [Bordetella sp. 02P26C-1]
MSDISIPTVVPPSPYPINEAPGKGDLHTEAPTAKLLGEIRLIEGYEADARPETAGGAAQSGDDVLNASRATNGTDTHPQTWDTPDESSSLLRSFIMLDSPPDTFNDGYQPVPGAKEHAKSADTEDIDDFEVMDYDTAKVDLPRATASASNAPALNSLSRALNAVCAMTIGTTQPEPSETPRTHFSQRLEQAKGVAMEIQDQLDLLQQRVAALTDQPAKGPVSGRIDRAQLSSWDKFDLLHCRVRGAATALMDTAETLGYAGAVASVGTLLGPIGMLGLGGVATVMTVKGVRNTSENANKAAVDAQVQTATKTINHKRAMLTALQAQEQHRAAVNTRLQATMDLRSLHRTALERALAEAEAALANRVETPTTDTLNSAAQLTQMANPVETIPASELERSEAARSSTNLLNRVFETLYRMVDTLLQEFNALKDYLYPPAPVSTARRYDQKAEHDEKSFRTNHKAMLEYLSLGKDDSRINENAPYIAHEKLVRAGGSQKIRFEDLQKDIHAGENITHAVLTSQLNFGAIDYTVRAGEREQRYAVPSNLTTARSIARYIEALAITNQQLPEEQKFALVSTKEDGSYIVEDPNGKLYSFLASSAAARLNAQSNDGQPTDALSKNAGRMTITDYSSSFPGGTQTMEFEMQVGEDGALAVAIRFGKEDAKAPVRPDAEQLADAAVLARKKSLNLVPHEASVSAASPHAKNFATMSPDEIVSYRDQLHKKLKDESRLLDAEKRHAEELCYWENPVFARVLAAQA